MEHSNLFLVVLVTCDKYSRASEVTELADYLLLSCIEGNETVDSEYQLLDQEMEVNELFAYRNWYRRNSRLHLRNVSQ